MFNVWCCFWCVQKTTKEEKRSQHLCRLQWGWEWGTVDQRACTVNTALMCICTIFSLWLWAGGTVQCLQGISISDTRLVDLDCNLLPLKGGREISASPPPCLESQGCLFDPTVLSPLLFFCLVLSLFLSYPHHHQCLLQGFWSNLVSVQNVQLKRLNDSWICVINQCCLSGCVVWLNNSKWSLCLVPLSGWLCYK